jgi:hypothetical protein
MGLSFTIAAGPRQLSYSRVRVPRDSWPYFTVSDSTLHQPGKPDPRIYIPQGQGGPVITSGTGFPFRRLLRLAGLRLRYLNRPPQGITELKFRNRKHFSLQFLFCCLRISCLGNLLLSNGCLLLAPLFRPSGVMSQYFENNDQFDSLYKVPRGTLSIRQNPHFGKQRLERSSGFKWHKEIFVNEGW